VPFFNHFNHCCVSCAAVPKQSICKMSVHGLTSCATIDESHKAKCVHRESTHTHTPYLESTHTHTHTIYFTGEETLHKMFYSRGDNLRSDRCAAIDESRKVEYVHRQYRLQNTLHRNLQPLQRALTSANERSLPPVSPWT
jgi:hypothetical protein